MGRISTHAANTFLFNQTLRLNERFMDGQVAISSEKKSQDYTGLNVDTRRLVNIENTRNLLSHYKKLNEQEDVRLSVTDTTLNSIRENIKDFSKSLATFSSTSPKDKALVEDIQANAFRTLFSIQDYLNTSVDGSYLYSGGKTKTVPVALGLTTVNDFQNTYDGSRTTFPITRDAHLDTFSLSKDTNNINKKHIDTSKFLQFRVDGDNDPSTAGTGSITASSSMFSHVTAGSYFTVSNTTNNNGSYVVDSVSADGRSINVQTKMFTDETEATGVTLTYADPVFPEKTIKLETGDLTNLTFTRSTDTMKSAASSGLSDLKVGSYFTVSGSSKNDGTYTVKSKTDDQTLVIESKKLTDEGLKRTNSGGTVALDLYTNTDVEFTASTKTIQIRQSGVSTGVADIFSSLTTGDTFTVSGSTSNNSTFTVASVSADGSSVTVTNSVTDETDTDGISISGGVTYTSGSQVTFTDVGAAGNDTIQVKDGAGTALANAFANLSIGDIFSISGSSAHDYAYYTVKAKSNSDSTVTIEENLSSTATDTSGVHIESNSGGTNFFNMITNTDIEFSSSAKTIQVREPGTTTAVPNIFVDLKVGNTFAVTGSASNNSTFTITAISSDKSQVTVSEAVTDETDTTGAVFTGTGDVSLSYTSGTQTKFTNVGAAGSDTIQILDSSGSALSGAFNDLTVGQTFLLSGAGPGYDNANYTITAKSTDGSTVTVAEDITGTTKTDQDGVKIQAFAVSGTLSASSYYKGDELTQSHRVSAKRTITDELTALDPSFEKAIRAMSLILQGKYGTAGGLDQNLERVGQARYLLASAQDIVGSALPTGLSTELTSNLQNVQVDLAYKRTLIKDTNALHTDIIGYYDAEVSDLENTDLTDTITRLLDDQRALEASFETYSRVRQLTLLNYL